MAGREDSQARQRDIRFHALASRSRISDANRELRALQAGTHAVALLKEWGRLSTVGLYQAIGSELSTTPLTEMLWAQGARTLTCMMADRTLDFAEFAEHTHWRHADFGVREPEGALTVPLGRIDAVIVPGVALDRAGNRIGYGQGWYDRTLQTVLDGPLRIGYIYDEQLVDSIPPQPHDVAMDAIVTPSTVIRCSQRAKTLRPWTRRP